MAKKTKPVPRKKSSTVTKKKAATGTKRPVIRITNDDGISAPGIQNLVEAVKDLGKIIFLDFGQ